jgi:hypothetical protein
VLREKTFQLLESDQHPGVGPFDANSLITATDEAQPGNFCIGCNRPFDYAITTEAPSGSFLAIKIVSFLTLDHNAIGC